LSAVNILTDLASFLEYLKSLAENRVILLNATRALKWMKETHRERKSRLSQEHLRLLRARRGGETKHGKSGLELLQELQDIFLPKTFRTFLKVEQDFYYHDCLRGADYYAAPFPTWPKFMIVITRTNLSLNKPAAVGLLDFNYLDFKRKIEELFERFL